MRYSRFFSILIWAADHVFPLQREAVNHHYYEGILQRHVLGEGIILVPRQCTSQSNLVNSRVMGKVSNHCPPTISTFILLHRLFLELESVITGASIQTVSSLRRSYDCENWTLEIALVRVVYSDAEDFFRITINHYLNWRFTLNKSLNVLLLPQPRNLVPTLIPRKQDFHEGPKLK